jgi:hypothetical protein
MRVSGELIPIVMFISIAFSIVGLPIARAYARKLDREPRDPIGPPDITGRLDRMEQAIDSIAIEVERISEGQRFTTKLLSERNNAPRASVARPPT